MMIKRQDIDLKGKTVLGRAVFKPPFKVNFTLTEEARFVHVIKGHSKMYVPNGHTEMHDGDSIILKCESVVNSWLPNENDDETEVFVVVYYPETLKYIYDDKLPDFLDSSNKPSSDPIAKIPPNGMISNFVDVLRYYYEQPELMTEELIKIKMRELILILVNSDKTGEIKAVLGNLFRSNQYGLKEIVHSHLYEDLALPDLAHMAGMSLSTFKRQFKKVFGSSPKQYIIEKRLDKAKNLLAESDRRISEVAYEIGFNDVGYFSKSFQAAFNVSPSDYRNSL